MMIGYSVFSDRMMKLFLWDFPFTEAMGDRERIAQNVLCLGTISLHFSQEHKKSAS